MSKKIEKQLSDLIDLFNTKELTRRVSKRELESLEINQTIMDVALVEGPIGDRTTTYGNITKIGDDEFSFSQVLKVIRAKNRFRTIESYNKEWHLRLKVTCTSLDSLDFSKGSKRFKNWGK